MFNKINVLCIKYGHISWYIRAFFPLVLTLNRRALCVRARECMNIEISSFEAMPNTCDYFTRTHTTQMQTKRSMFAMLVRRWLITIAMQPPRLYPIPTSSYRITKALSDIFCFWIKLPVRVMRRCTNGFLSRSLFVPCTSMPCCLLLYAMHQTAGWEVTKCHPIIFALHRLN